MKRVCYIPNGGIYEVWNEFEGHAYFVYDEDGHTVALAWELCYEWRGING
jgi:hypothetical protein